MNRAMASFFPGVQPEAFGPYAGVAQQALFVYSRSHPEQVRNWRGAPPKNEKAENIFENSFPNEQKCSIISIDSNIKLIE